MTMSNPIGGQFKLLVNDKNEPIMDEEDNFLIVDMEKKGAPYVLHKSHFIWRFLKTRGPSIYDERERIEFFSEQVTAPLLAERGATFYCENTKMVIFNHMNFEGKPEDQRPESMVDVENFLKTFEDFQCEVHTDKTSQQVKEIVEQLGQNIDREISSIIIVILSHGLENGSILGSDNIFYHLQDLYDRLSPSVCPAMAGKPIQFWTNACRGRLKCPSVTLELENAKAKTIPAQGDYFFAFSCSEGFLSYKNDGGTPWASAVCEEFKRHGKKHDVVTMFTNVNLKVGGRKFNKIYKQAPCFESHLPYKLMLCPKAQHLEEEDRYKVTINDQHKIILKLEEENKNICEENKKLREHGLNLIQNEQIKINTLQCQLLKISLLEEEKKQHLERIYQLEDQIENLMKRSTSEISSLENPEIDANNASDENATTNGNGINAVAHEFEYKPEKVFILPDYDAQ